MLSTIEDTGNEGRRTDADINLPADDLSRNLVHCGQTGRALPVDGRDGCGDWDAGVEAGHTCSTGTAARRQDVADSDVFDKGGVEVDLAVNGAEDAREDLLGPCVFEAALLALR